MSCSSPTSVPLCTAGFGEPWAAPGARSILQVHAAISCGSSQLGCRPRSVQTAVVSCGFCLTQHLPCSMIHLNSSSFTLFFGELQRIFVNCLNSANNCPRVVGDTWCPPNRTEKHSPTSHRHQQGKPHVYITDTYSDRINKFHPTAVS